MATDITTLGIKVDSRQVVQADDALDDLADSASRAETEVEDFGNAAQKAGKKTKNLNKNAKDAKTNMGGMSRQAGQAGIQIQQLVGQIQGGTSAFTALSQQGADLGIVLGAPLLGVIGSLSAVLVGTLVSAFSRTEAEGEDLAEQIRELSNEFRNLTEAQAQFLTLNLNKRMAESAERTAELKEHLKDNADELDRFNARIDTARITGHAKGVEVWTQRAKEQSEAVVTISAQLDNEAQSLGLLKAQLDDVNAAREGTLLPKGRQPWWGGDAEVERDAAAIRAGIIQDGLDSIQAAREENTAGYQSVLQMQYQSTLAFNALEQEANDDLLARKTQAIAAYTDGRIAEEERVAKAAVDAEKTKQKNTATISRAADSVFRDLMKSQSKELFEIGKIGAAGKAAFDAYGAINATLAQGGALAAPAAWAIGAAAFANVSSILSSKFGSPATSAGSAPSIPPPQQQGDTVQNTEMTINITGGVGFTIDDLQELFDNDAVAIRQGTAQFNELQGATG